MADSANIPAAFAGQVDLASSAVGGQCLACSDDFFAEVEHLVNPAPAVFDPDAYTDRGKEMDGWESRRKRVPGHDWAIIQLGVRGQVRGVDIDTSFFMGNHPPNASVEACNVSDDVSVQTLRESQVWTEIVPSMPLQRGSHNLQAVAVVGTWTHVRLRIYPDGGVARLRVWGEPRPVQNEGQEVDVACVLQGGRALACSDMFFSPMNNLVLPEPAINMGGGWETKRSRPPSDDWIIVQLGSPSMLSRAVVDTRHFKGNFPDTVALDGLFWPDAPVHELVDCTDWTEIVSRFETRADAAHDCAVEQPGPFTHVRLRIYPDGGVSRLQVHGTPTAKTPADDDPRLSWLNALSAEECVATLMRCCGSTRWAERMADARPFTSWTHAHGVARTTWWEMDDADWQEAFTHHPKIGASPEALREKFAATSEWSSGEQAGVGGADGDVIDNLAKGNQDYEERFGYIFIVCASGLTAAQMLAKLTNRMGHTPENEIRIAAGQQAMITALRLDKLETS
jgi:allantoicase